MSKIRPAHTTVLIERRLKDCEAGTCDALELAGIHDELARVERKWQEQTAGNSPRRSGNDAVKLNGWFDRLARQIERAVREHPSLPAAEKTLLDQALAAIRSRTGGA
jgi:sigma54-dependent transcription regulator